MKKLSYDCSSVLDVTSDYMELPGGKTLITCYLDGELCQLTRTQIDRIQKKITAGAIDCRYFVRGALIEADKLATGHDAAVFLRMPESDKESIIRYGERAYKLAALRVLACFQALRKDYRCIVRAAEVVDCTADDGAGTVRIMLTIRKMSLRDLAAATKTELPVIEKLFDGMDLSFTA